MLGMVSSAEKLRVGALIRNRRQELGWDQTAFAGHVGVSRTAVSNWERGRAYPLRYTGKIEAVLRISLSAPAPPDPVEESIRGLDLAPAVAAKLIELYRELMNPGVQPSVNGGRPHSTTG